MAAAKRLSSDGDKKVARKN